MNGLFGGHFVGEVVGNRTLVEYKEKNKHGHHTWTWSCIACGDVSGPSTISHMKRNAACKGKCAWGSTSPRWKGHNEISGRKFYDYKYGAKKRNIEWNITIEELWDIWIKQDGKCAYTGRPLKHGVDASPDRINSSLPYEAGNVEWVHVDVNWAKRSLSRADFVKLCSEIANHRPIPPADAYAIMPEPKVVIT